MKKYLILIIIFALTCGQAFAGTLTLVFFDLSGSVLTDNTGSKSNDSPYNKNMSELKKEIKKLGKGDSLVIVGFGRKSDVVLLRATFPKQAGPMNRNITATRDAAVKKLQENIANRAKSIDNTKTDVIGSLFRASRLIEESNTSEITRRKIIIFSDMLDTENIGLSLSGLKTTGAHKEFLKKLDAMNIGHPNLKNVEIELFSTFSDVKGINTVETEISIKELKQFWTTFITASSGNITSYRTNY
jgi:hypothetical protein